MFRTRKIRAQAKVEGKTFDDIAKEYEEQGREFKFAEREVKIFGRKGKGDVGDIETTDIEIGKGA